MAPNVLSELCNMYMNGKIQTILDAADLIGELQANHLSITLELNGYSVSEEDKVLIDNLKFLEQVKNWWDTYKVFLPKYVKAGYHEF